MSLFADKWTSPFSNNPFRLDDFYTTSFGEFRLGSNCSIFKKQPKVEEDCQPLEMKLRNGSMFTDRGFYDHFDSIFHDRSRRYDLRSAASDSSRRSPPPTGKGKEYIIPIKFKTSTQDANQTSKNSRTESASAASNSSTPRAASGRAIEIPIVVECPSPSPSTKTRRDKSRSPILLKSSTDPTSSYKVLTPTTEEIGGLQRKDNSGDVVLDSDVFFVKSSHADPQKQSQSVKPESDIEVVEIEDDDSFMRSLRRKPLRHQQNSSSISLQGPVLVNRRSRITAASTKKPTTSPEDNSVNNRDERSQSQKEPESKRQLCSHPGRFDVTATPSYPIYDYLKPELATQDRQIDYIRGDGNCFFRAISKAVYGSEAYHPECRQAVCDLIHAHPDLFRQYIDHSSITTHIIDMRVMGTWATTCEIYAAAALLGREIYVLAPSPSSDAQYHWLLFSPRSLTGPSIGGSLRRQREEEGGDRGDPCYVTLCHTNANHYDHITPIAACCNCQLPVPRLNGVSTVLDLTTSDQEEILRKE
ncbi:uncharacterized protein LOC143291704 [Babylonia areolata]|uniref:uncharacterized protein LOC143291704 n=1 Tax=Babylonia areolata TaxID=304850 RepID=UPI003FD2C6CA